MPTISIEVIADVARAKRALDDLSGSVSGIEDDLDRLTPYAAAGAAAVTGIGVAAYNAASEAQQAAGAIESVFGRFADQINANARDAATSVGLASSEYQNFATVLGSQLKNMGTPMDQVAGQTDDLIALGADLAATFGGSTADAVSALSSLMRGERDPIERYGVSINQAAIDAQLAAMGLDGLTGAAATNANAQATLALLTQQTSAAQGQFARETDSAAGAAQIASAQWQDASAQLGTGLLPIITRVTTALGGLATWVSNNTTVVTILLGVIGTFSAAILAANAALKIYKATQAAIQVATKVWTGVQAALNLVMSLNPITIVVLAIGALVAAVILAYKNSETFRNIVNKLWSAIKTGAKTVGEWFKYIGQWIANVASRISSSLSGAWNRFWGSVKTGASNVGAWFKYISDWVRTIASNVTGALGAAWNWVLGRWNAFYRGVTSGFNWIISLIRSAKSWINSLFSSSMPGWLRTVTSWFGVASLAPEDGTAPAIARAAALDSTATTMAGLVAPAAFAPSSGGTGLNGSTPTVVNITVEGALDPEAVARQIEGLLTKLGRRRGTVAIGSTA